MRKWAGDVSIREFVAYSWTARNGSLARKFRVQPANK